MTTFRAKVSLREFDSNDIRESLSWIHSLSWQREKWKPRAALVDSNGQVTHLYTGQRFDPHYFRLVEGAWTHDHCDLCASRIEEEDPCGIAEGAILCHWCMEDFVKGPETH